MPMTRIQIVIAMAAIACESALGQTAGKLDTASIDADIGAKGALIEGEVGYKVTFPRNDVPIAVDGRKMEPFMGFTSWAAFQAGKSASGSSPDSAMVMGDLVLFEDEVNPVMSALLDAGVSVTALHNHFF